MKQRKRKLKWVFATLTLVFAIGMVTGCTSSTDKAKTSDETKENKEKTKFKVGETAEYDGVQVTLKKVISSKGDGQFISPQKGKKFVLCNFEIINNSSKDITISSIMSFKAYCDDVTLDYDIMGMQAPQAEGFSQLDGTIAAGKKMDGVISYQVPKKWKTLEIIVTPSFWSQKDIKFIAKNK